MIVGCTRVGAPCYRGGQDFRAHGRLSALPTGGDLSGRIGYVHASGIDAPLSMLRNNEPVILHRNWRGTYDMATDSNGKPIHCMPSGGVGCDDYPWPGWSPISYPYPPALLDTHICYGSLALNQYDESGLAYRRNRYYDPVSAQFTQQDPIGIAGGLNLYGYANGDPVNFSDPVGLAPCEGMFDPDDDSTWDAWAECMRKNYEEEDAQEAAEGRRKEQLKQCSAVSVGLAARVLVDAALIYSWGSGLQAVARGSLRMAEGAAISTGLIQTATANTAAALGLVPVRKVAATLLASRGAEGF
jgi:RHS repeat-associated protein